MVSGLLQGTCKEGLGVEVPWVPWHSEQQHTALTVTVQPTAIHHRTCRQVADGLHIPACPAPPPPGIKAGIPKSILMPKSSLLLHVNRHNGGVKNSVQWLLNIACFDVLPATKPEQVERLFCSYYLYAGLEICGRISQHNMGFDWLIFSLWLQGSVKTVNLLESPAGLWWL